MKPTPAHQISEINDASVVFDEIAGPGEHNTGRGGLTNRFRIL
jgi:hypothetical protein